MKKKTLIIIVLLIIFAIIITFITIKVKKRNNLSSSTNSSSNSGTFPLKQGSRGTEVKNVQNMLNKIIPADLEVDGIFGPKTEASLQKRVGLRQLTKKQYEKFIEIMAGQVLLTALYESEKSQIINA